MRNSIKLLAAVMAILAAFDCAQAAPKNTQSDSERIQLIREKAAASNDELGGKLTLFFRDALTGRAIPDAQVSLENESGTTDADGSVSFTFPQVPEETDTYLYARFNKKGYVAAKVPLHFMVGTIFANHYSISPSLPPGNLRIVLDWGAQPPDLDSHFLKKGGYHISFRDMHKIEEQARLDRDDIDGEGPETITVEKLDAESDYVYFVHDYTNRGDPSSRLLPQSKAHVSIYTDKELFKTFEVPAGGRGRYWTVFHIRKGEIIPVSSLGSEPVESLPPSALRPE